MSKRTRGTARTQHRRPGTRPTTSRPASRRRDPASRPELDEALLIDETLEIEALAAGTADQPASPQPAGDTPATTRATRAGRAHHRVKAGSLLAARAATEYVYVAQDLKRISIVGALIVGALIVLWLLIVVLRVVPLPFY